MYDRDMPIMRKHALASPDGLVDVITFVLLTIQQPFPYVARQFADVREKGAQSVYLFGAKRAGYQYAQEHKEVLHAAMVAAIEVKDVVGIVNVLTSVPGLGMVKASFVAQICGLETACLDMHNLARLGMPATTFRSVNALKDDTRRAKIADYVALCARTGGARKWWNDWCEFVAGRRNSPLKSGDEVSAFHVAALGLS
jgi:hypothetical protein